jgi:hypothetical protein
MAANNQNIAHFGPLGRPLCRDQRSHIVVRERERFDQEPRPCKRCLALLVRGKIADAERVLRRTLTTGQRSDLILDNFPAIKDSVAAHELLRRLGL